MALMMEEELNEVVGEKGKHDRSRSATRHGSEAGSAVLGGRKVAVIRPRARHVDGSGEVELATYAQFAKEDLLGQMALERMVAGLSTRNYSAGLEPVGDVEATGTKRSSVSRRFVERTTTALKELMSKDLSECDIVALLLDGVEIAGHTMIVALGIDAKGHKHPLGLREGTTENKGVCRALLSDLIERGLTFDDGILVVIDGGKALRAAVNSVFGRMAVVQRCQIHKRRINRPSGLDQPAAAGSPPSFFSRPRCPSRLSITRPWRATSLSQPRPAASSRSARTSASWSSMTGTNSAAGTKLSQVSQMLAYGQASPARWREQYPWATRVLSISEESHCTRSGTTGFPAGISVRGWRNRSCPSPSRRQPAPSGTPVGRIVGLSPGSRGP